MRTLALLALALAAGTAVPALAQPKPSTSITIYSSAAPGAIDPSLYRPLPGWQPWQYQQMQTIPGYALVREDRPIRIEGNQAEVRFTDVASLIDPTTVQFTSLTDARTTVLEQNYQFDLVSGEKLLQKFIDQDVRVTVVRGQQPEFIDGTLLSSGGGQLVLRMPSGSVRMINGYADVQFLGMPKGLMTRPTLVWRVATDRPGDHTARVSYQTEGITWWADYNLAFTEGANANSGWLDVSGWVSIINQSGAGYNDATLKLIAGDVHRAPKGQGPLERYPAARSEAMSTAADTGFQEKSFFEYHLYTLGRPASIPNNSTKQLELFPKAERVPCEKVVVYDGLGPNAWWGEGLYTDQSVGVQTSKDVDVYLKFKNGLAEGMGMPLPAGRIRVNKVDSDDGSMEFIGEDVIRHTPREEEVLVKMGRAFDIVGERVQQDFKYDASRRTIEETYEIKVRNRKKEAVKVIVQEHMYRWSQWEVIKTSVPGTKLSSRLMHFPLTLEPDAEGVVRYTVRYTW
jgi:hypothetical protein